ncbi:MAG: alpha/beta fold hydrolase [Sporolactobacillus sp.]
MRIRLPSPFFYEEGPRAVLLLHGLTGNSIDVHQLGLFLRQRGYTCYAPQYRGHASTPEALLRSSPADWWQDVRRAYGELSTKGYSEIAVCGLSIGGLFSLKCGYTFAVKGIVPMCAPAVVSSAERLSAGVLRYAEKLKRYAGIGDEEIADQLEAIRAELPAFIASIDREVRVVQRHLSEVIAPLFIVQARRDEMVDSGNAFKIYQAVSSAVKHLKWYEQSTHVITLGPERQHVYQDIADFLASLNWSE